MTEKDSFYCSRCDSENSMLTFRSQGLEPYESENGEKFCSSDCYVRYLEEVVYEAKNIIYRVNNGNDHPDFHHNDCPMKLHHDLVVSKCNCGVSLVFPDAVFNSEENE